jgi:hypothetical protein
MSSLLYKIINPPIKRLLKSPFHRVLSKNTLLLEFKGRKSGRALSTPISYHVAGGSAHCFTSREYGWWQNLRDDATVQIVVKGERIKTVAKVVTETDSTASRQVMADALHSFLLAVPRDASHAGVKLGENGQPNPDDINQVISGMVYLSFEM